LTSPAALFATGRLWSLLDMYELNGEAFYRVVNWLTAIDRNGLFQAKGPDWLKLLSDVETEPQMNEGMLVSAQKIAQSISKLPTPVTAMAISELITSIEKKECRVCDLIAAAQEIGRTFRRELSTITFYHINPAHRGLLEAEQLFGPKVAEKYPMAQYDIEEAGNCLALQRPTACVMHLMRVLEIGLQSLAREFGVPDNQDNWNSILNQIDRVIPEITAKRHSAEDEQWFSEVGSHFRLLKNGFRNHAMHVHSNYTEDQAENMFNHTKAFMQQLATRLSDPLGALLG